jgi:Lytic polysaccharide mono-oxygenase, cellulose-degrading
MSIRSHRLPVSIGLVGAVSLAAPAASAHVQLRAPQQRDIDQKAGPCGLPDSTRGENVCEFQPGATITVEWDETVEHPGHFRVSFDDDGTDDLIDPSDYDDYYASEAVLVDEIGDRDVGADGNPRYSMQIELPDIECDNCTLQLIQVMSDKPPWGPEGGDDIYYQCADLVLSPDAPAEPAPDCGATTGEDAGPDPGGESDAGGASDAGSGGEGEGSDGTSDDASDTSDEGGCATSGSSSGTGLLIALAALALACRRCSRPRRST